ncbi:MAG TPA: redoxin domain-containing protein [Chloroflexota bacterium]|nr:redoxin domain-containing protein [Chloroflexota bacterium]
MRRALWAVVIAVPVIVLLATGFGRDPNVVATPMVGKRAPAFNLDRLSGGRLSIASLKGRPVLVNFWASWCTSCVQEQPYLRSVWKAYGKRVAFVGVDYQESAGDARSYLRHSGPRWTILEDPGQQTAINFGVTGVPETFLIDRNGVVRYHFAGPIIPGTSYPPSLLERDLKRLVTAA